CGALACDRSLWHRIPCRRNARVGTGDGGMGAVLGARPAAPLIRQGPAETLTAAYLTARLTSSRIAFSSALPIFTRAKDVGHMLPSSRFAVGWKPRVEYRSLNLAALWKNTTTFPSLP